jgi:hypothetical protein
MKDVQFPVVGRFPAESVSTEQLFDPGTIVPAPVLGFCAVSTPR